MRFRGTNGGSYYGDLAIDDITIEENPALPVELISFTAEAIENDFIQLNWETATEENNLGFDVLRSINGKDFEKIGFIEGQGTTLETSNYTFNDENVADGIWYYYQLKQVDLDGQFELTNIVSANLKAENKLAISEPFPNPTNQSASIEISTSDDLDFEILIYNQLGQIIEQQQINTTNTNNRIDFNTSNWSEGIYFITIKNENFRTTKKLVVQK